MNRKYKAIKIGEEGLLTDGRGDPITCPIRETNCSARCAWFSAEDRILRCQNTIIGALKGKPVRSFRLHTGPPVYDLDESLSDYEEANEQSLTGS